MNVFWQSVLIGLVLLTFPGWTQADEALFGYVATTDSLPEGRNEYQQWNTLRAGKAAGTYASMDMRNGIGRGVTAAFQSTIYLNSSFLYTKDVYDPANLTKNLPNQSDFNVNGASVEMKYRFMSPYKDLFGLSGLIEPALTARDPQTGAYQSSFEIHSRIIGQKNYLDDQIISAFNFAISPKWTETSNAAAQKVFLMDVGLAGSYRFAPRWFMGGELRNKREFARQSLGAQTYSAFFLGPTVHYGGKEWWGTLSVLPQIGGTPRVLGQDLFGNTYQDSARHLGKQEKIEVRVKFGFNFLGFK